MGPLNRKRFLVGVAAFAFAPLSKLEHASSATAALPEAAAAAPPALTTIYRVTSMRFAGAGARWLEIGDIMRFQKTGEAVRLIRRHDDDDSWDVVRAIGAVEQSDVSTGDEAHVVATASFEGEPVRSPFVRRADVIDWREDMLVPRVVSIA